MQLFNHVPFTCYAQDPYMFHQANLNFHDTEDGSSKSLLTWWIESVMENFQRYNSLPIFTLKVCLSVVKLAGGIVC